MNEELKILIKAVVDDAKKNLDSVKKELEEIEKQGKETGKALDSSLKKVGKGALIAVAAITAVVTAIINLGKKSQEFQKTQAKLISGFQAVGLSTNQALSTYKDLFRFLGESDRAGEAANHLALLTQNEKHLAEWTKILQGVYARFGDSLPVEGLAEAANETLKVGKVTGTLADALNWAGVSEDEFNNQLANTTSLQEREALLRSTLNNLYSNAANLYERNNKALIAYNESQANLDITLARATQYITPLLTALNNLATALLTVLTPALSTIATYFTAFIQLIAEAITWVGNFFGMFGGSTTKAKADVEGYTAAMKAYTSSLSTGFSDGADSIKDTNKQIQELKKQTMGFDELNILSSQQAVTAGGTSGGGGAGGGAILTPPDPSDYGIGGDLLSLDSMLGDIDEAKQKLEGVLFLVGLIAAGFIAWKIASFISQVQHLRTILILTAGDAALADIFTEAKDELDLLKQKVMTFVGVLMIIAGAILLIKGYTDAWVNGVDWGNFALMLSGIGLIVGGMAMAFGPLAAAISMIVGGIALLVVGIKDLITNGYSMEAVITVAVGAILVLVGAVWAFNSALLANPITWIVVAIMALVAAFVVLWNECEGFRNFWKQVWEAIKVAFSAVWEWIKQAAKDIAQFFVDAWHAIENIWKAIPGFFKGLWEDIKKAFSAVGKWFSDIFTDAWNGIKKAFSAVGSFFKGVWKTITDIFSKVGKTISDAVSGAFTTAINWVLSKAIGIINGFISAINAAISVINAIPGVSIKKLKKLEVPKLATGGIVSGATLAMIGERGKEAVLPLENNTGWMDMLAERLASKNKTPTKIVLAVDGRELGYATLDSINNITQQTGKLQLVIA